MFFGAFLLLMAMPVLFFDGSEPRMGTMRKAGDAASIAG
jgi:hypothetical protein